MHRRLLIGTLLTVILTPAFSAPHSVHALQSSPTIDGIINEQEWPGKQAANLSRAFHDKRGIKLYYAHDAKYLYLAADVEDQQLWADGSGNGTGNIWDTFDDDSIEWYFDLNLSKETHLQSTDRFLALNIGNFANPINGQGIVSRRSFNAGTGNGGASGILDPHTLDGIRYHVTYRGTVNTPSDIDEGYSIEVAIPWELLPNTSHNDGDSIGINTIIVSDDSGSTRDYSDNRNISPPALLFTLPVLIDEYVELKHSPQSSSQSGLSGPSAYTRLLFQTNNDVQAPSMVANFVAAHPRPYSVRLQWNNPGDSFNTGMASGFDIRYSTQPITEDNFQQARQWPFNQQANFDFYATTNIRVMGLLPSTQYYFAVRAYDEVNNFGPIAYSKPLSTSSISALKSAIPADKYQGLAAIAPGGRYFIKENGQALIPIGTQYLHQDDAIRYLYNDDIWTGKQCHNFTKNPEAKQKVSDYMAQLKANGITVMRLFLEDFSLNVPNNAPFNQANCAYWLESPRGTFNAKMADFIIDILRLSAENGIYVLISPFDTFFYDNYLPRTAWHTSQGGPLTDINNFYTNPDVLAMAKTRWSWVINTINNSGYGDAVFAYEILNEWDSFEWTRPDIDANKDAQIRQKFITELAAHVRSLDDEHLLVSSSTALDPRGALGSFIYDSPTFDAVLPHLYLPNNREPWNNLASDIGTATVTEQANILSWWTSNQASAKPVLNGEWGPSDAWLPNPNQPGYFFGFTQEGDELLTRKLWFTELASGAAGPGIRMPGGVRGGPALGLHLSETMFSTASTISSFVSHGIDFTNFTSMNLQKSVFVSNSLAPLIVTGSSDAKQGLIYIHQDRNKSSSTISNAQLNIGSLLGGAARQAEFWSTAPNQTQAQHIVMAKAANIATPNDSNFIIPDFNDDWMIKFSELYSTRLITWRNQGQQVLALAYENMDKAGAVDVYIVYILNGETFSLVRNAQGQLTSVSGIAAWQVNASLSSEISELISLPISGNINIDVYIATLRTGTPVESLDFKTLQLLTLHL